MVRRRLAAAAALLLLAGAASSFGLWMIDGWPWSLVGMLFLVPALEVGRWLHTTGGEPTCPRAPNADASSSCRR